MRTQVYCRLLAASVGLLIVGAWTADAGDLNPPPGPIQPTNRVQLNAQAVTLPLTITQSGSYVLTSDLTGVTGQVGVFVEADDVTIDLNGFALIGVAGSLHGISSPATGIKNLAVRNGVVRDWGSTGVNAFFASSSQFENLRVSDNGLNGIAVSSGSTVTGCTADGNASSGITTGSTTRFACTITRCTARNNGASGIIASNGSVVRDCAAEGNGIHGIAAFSGAQVSNCAAQSNGGSGFTAETGSTIRGCTSTLNTANGIQVAEACRVEDNTCHANGNLGTGAGILVTGGTNRIEDNTCTSNDVGIDVDGCANLIVGNSAGDNTTNYSIRSALNCRLLNPNRVGAISTTPATAGPWDNFEF